MDELRQELQDLKKFPRQDESTVRPPFVPESALYSLLTTDRVRNALANSAFGLEHHQREQVAREVIDEARKIFAILVEMRIEERLKKFLDNCLTDPALPILDGGRLHEILPESTIHFQSLQWQYVPQKFRERTHKNLRPGCVLPFVEDKKLASGAFSTVFRAKIHPEYQDWQPGSAESNVRVFETPLVMSV